MQLAKDGTIILGLDKVAEANHMTVWCELCQSPQQQISPQQLFMGEPDLAHSLREELVTIQFGTLEPVVPSLMVPTTVVEVDPVLGILDEDDEGWTLVTRRTPRK